MAESNLKEMIIDEQMDAGNDENFAFEDTILKTREVEPDSNTKLGILYVESREISDLASMDIPELSVLPNAQNWLHNAWASETH